MDAKIYHNPKCSKSRATLEILKENNIEPTIIEYLKTPPTVGELKSILDKLHQKPTDIIRFNESIAKELNLNLKDDRDETEWLNIMVSNPKLIERPIVVTDKKAAIGRPPESVLKIF